MKISVTSYTSNWNFNCTKLFVLRIHVSINCWLCEYQHKDAFEKKNYYMYGKSNFCRIYYKTNIRFTKSPSSSIVYMIEIQFRITNIQKLLATVLTLALLSWFNFIRILTQSIFYSDIINIHYCFIQIFFFWKGEWGGGGGRAVRICMRGKILVL